MSAPQLPVNSRVGSNARVSGVIAITSLFVFTPVMYADIDGALSVTCASFEYVFTNAVSGSVSMVSSPSSPTA